MKSFKEYLKEYASPFSAFPIGRASMPQIKDPKDFSKFLSDKGIIHDFLNQDPEEFKPTQCDKDESKIDRLINIIRTKPKEFQTYAPVVVSSDGFVLDGHHRYFACLRAGVNMNTITVYLTINQLLKAANEYKELQSG